MYNIGDAVRVKHDGAIGAIIGVETIGATTRYKVLVNSRTLAFFEDQIMPINISENNDIHVSRKERYAL